MKAAAFDYQSPRDLAEAISLCKAADGMAKYASGGQSLGPMLNLRLTQPGLIIDLRQVDELRGVSETADHVRIGGGTTHAAIEDGRVPDPTHGMMRYVARGIAYRPVRNRGSIGGSLAHADPAADWVSAMALLGAMAIITDEDGERRLPLDAFLQGAYTTPLGDTAILTAVEVPKLSAAARWGYYKICRKTGEFAQAIGAVLIDPARGTERAVIGATNGAPILLTGAEPETRAAAALDRAGIAEPGKRQLLLTALRRAGLMARNGAPA